MRNSLILCGSSRMNGVTDTMCRAAAETLNGLGYRSAIVYVGDGIAHCRNCGLCRDGECVIDDGMVPIYEAFSDADLLVIASPVHFSGPSSQIKTVIDRFQPYWFADKSHPSKAVGLICGGSEHPEFRYAAGIFRAFSAMMKMEWLGHLEISGTDSDREGVEKAVKEFLLDKIGDGEEQSVFRNRPPDGRTSV